MGINASMALEDIEDLRGDLEILRGRLQQEADEVVRKTADEFREELKNTIKKSEIDEETGELLNSWKVRPKGVAKYEVRSTAEHAVWLELGTESHPIVGDPLLIFEPEPGTRHKYPPHTVRDDGMIEIHEVDHPGNEPYGYFQETVDKKSWEEILSTRLEATAERVLEEFAAGD